MSMERVGCMAFLSLCPAYEQLGVNMLIKPSPPSRRKRACTQRTGDGHEHTAVSKGK